MPVPHGALEGTVANVSVQILPDAIFLEEPLPDVSALEPPNSEYEQ